ncbi:hypothetical protein BDV96DRAFT_654961 [Lophiotrema nucula]|uniref:Uncharacterized protein n=1 Tax=Lophiotrema nucula TaxID=690887 RepID=A0A6A5YGN0_9PLEO|nr:hypothetical protein BDV96DRAFT_654961 [Lophiotrema nucula]
MPDPSLLAKAYAVALRSFLSMDELAFERGEQALFIANPRQLGIPAATVNEAFVNEAIFDTADAIQTGKSIEFSREGRSYFKTLRSYVARVKLDPAETSPEMRVAHEHYLDLADIVDREFEDAVEKYRLSKKVDKKTTTGLQEWLQSDFGRSYRDAVTAKQKWSATLTKLQSPQMSEVANARDMLDSAGSIDSPKAGSNMICSLKNRGDNALQTPATDELIYRPSYILNDYNTISEGWVTNYSQTSSGRQEVPLDLVAAQTTTWKGLGFASFDGSGAPPNAEIASTAEQDHGKPIIDLSKLDLKDILIKVDCANIQPFDVMRGLWDIQDFRNVLPVLSEGAPQYLEEQFYKTTKILLAYDVDMVVEVPASTHQGASSGTEVQIKHDVLGVIPATVGADGKLHTQMKSDKNNAYVSILAVLAERV